LAVAVGPGFVEEFWCRGLMGRVLTPRIGIVAGVAVTSFLFGAMHMDPAQLPAFICMGAFLHFVYFATRSIWASILLHVMNNASAVVLALTLSPEKAAQPTPFVVVIAGLALLIFGGIALWTSRAAVRPVSVRAESSEWKPEYPGISAPPPDTGLRLEHEAVSPVAFIFTILSFGMLVYLGYRFLA
jgi:hypothetical protein